MILLVSGATTTVEKYKLNPHIGKLMTPQACNLYDPDFPTGVDNAAYSNWDEYKFLKLIDSIVGKSVLWVAAPDFVGDARSTETLYDKWYQEIKEQRKLPIALVLQNGQEEIGLPPEELFDAIFIGGDDEFKMGGYVRYCVNKVKEIGKLVHMGRVNSWERLKYAIDIGCHSVDGSGFSRFSELKIPQFLKMIAEYKQNQNLF